MKSDNKHRVRIQPPEGRSSQGTLASAPGVASPAALHLRSVVKTYPTGDGTFVALSGVDLDLEGGEFLAIVGKSGSGKSTLLNVLTGIDRATSGMVCVNGMDLTGMSENELARWRGRNVGLVFQFQQLMPTLTILENVMMPMDLVGVIPRTQRAQKARGLLVRVGVEEHADKFPSQLSGGQQQRAAIARSLANDPPILAADEPTGNLDSASAEQILDLFRELASAGSAVVMVTHEREIASHVDRVVTVLDGRIGDSGA